MYSWYKELKSLVGGFICKDEILARHTSIKIGGPARVWVEPKDVSDLKTIVSFAHEKRVPLKVIGAGSNILFSDKGYEGIILCLKNTFFCQMNIDGLTVRVGAGARLVDLIRKMASAELGGVEFLTGIPGTIGGATVVNAGVRRPDDNGYQGIGDIIEQVKVMDYKGQVRGLRHEDLKFSYRWSNLSGLIILEVALRLCRKTEKEIKTLERTYREYRQRTQPLNALSLGCVFRNPRPDLSGGKLIESCGLKGRQIGQAQISCRHANFIVNLGQATCQQVLGLIDLAQQEVWQQFKIKLEPEIEIVL